MIPHEYRLQNITISYRESYITVLACSGVFHCHVYEKRCFARHVGPVRSTPHPPSDRIGADPPCPVGFAPTLGKAMEIDLAWLEIFLKGGDILCPACPLLSWLCWLKKNKIKCWIKLLILTIAKRVINQQT